MVCPHCGNEMYSQLNSFNLLDNGTACNPISYTVTSQFGNVNLAPACNPIIPSYPVWGNVTFRCDAATGTMTQVQEEV